MGYIAVIGDIVESRSIPDRADFQKRLAELFRDLSAGRSCIESPYTITLGDEFQALYSGAQDVFADAFTILAQAYPSRIRLAFGVGEITTAINRDHAIGMDGPAFHIARETMDSLKSEDETIVQLSIQHPRNPRAIELANKALVLVREITRTWKENTWAVTRDTMHDESVDSIADTLSITTRAVYKNMRTNGVRGVIDLCRGVAGLLDAEVG